MVNVSSNNFGGILVRFQDVGGVPVISGYHELSHFDTDGNIFQVDEITTADMVITADGKALSYGKNEPVVVSLSVAPFIPLSNILSMTLSHQQSTAVSRPIIPLFTLTTWYDTQYYEFLDGILHKGTIAPTVGQERIGQNNFTFKFRLAVPIPPIG